jgi:hypothetical protein
MQRRARAHGDVVLNISELCKHGRQALGHSLLLSTFFLKLLDSSTDQPLSRVGLLGHRNPENGGDCSVAAH